MSEGDRMSRLEDYANKYQCVRFERRDGILQMTLHTDGASLRWGFGPHAELPEAFHDVGTDRDNRVVILTGTGHLQPLQRPYGHGLIVSGGSSFTSVPQALSNCF
jgi:1,4-dihydroxy-2-naphthoyl-CoA synthase